jgi:hypothetical protein
MFDTGISHHNRKMVHVKSFFVMALILLPYSLATPSRSKHAPPSICTIILLNLQPIYESEPNLVNPHFLNELSLSKFMIPLKVLSCPIIISFLCLDFLNIK